MMIKTPLNYIGGKTKLLPQILPLFPKNIDRFIDLFAGGCNVGVNVMAKQVILNDNLSHLIDMYLAFKKHSVEDIIVYIESRIMELQLSKVNKDGYLNLRSQYNEFKNPLDLFVLIAYSYNHQIRFNNSHKYNNPFGKNRSSFNANMKKNLLAFLKVIKQEHYQFLNLSFESFDFSDLTHQDLVYCDPPYLITTGSYNDGKRGFKGWSETEELDLLKLLDQLDKQGVRFALSNVIEHKGSENHYLKNWLQQREYNCYDLLFHYRNTSYQNKKRKVNSSKEVLVTNYQRELPLVSM